MSRTSRALALHAFDRRQPDGQASCDALRFTSQRVSNLIATSASSIIHFMTDAATMERIFWNGDTLNLFYDGFLIRHVHQGSKCDSKINANSVSASAGAGIEGFRNAG